MIARYLGLILVSALLYGCASHSPKLSTATGGDAFAEFFAGTAVDTTGKPALSYELRPPKPDTTSTATGRETFDEFFAATAADTTGRPALSYEPHPPKPDTRFPLVIDRSPPPASGNEGFEIHAYVSQAIELKGGSMMPGTHVYRGDLIDTVPHSLK